MEIKFRGKLIGKVHGNTFFTTRSERKHFFHIFQGYGISEEVLDSLPDTTEYVVFVVHEKEGIWNYKIKREYVKSKGKEWIDATSHDKQFIVALEDMEREKL